MIYVHNNILKGFKAADIIRIDQSDQWETVVGPGSISGIGPGFDHWPNNYIWSMAVHDGWLYTGTYDQVTALASIPDNLGTTFSGTNAKTANLMDTLGIGGADLYKSQDGVTWYQVTVTGLGDVGNYGFRTMKSVGNDLFIGTANPYDGSEVRRGRVSSQ